MKEGWGLTYAKKLGKHRSCWQVAQSKNCLEIGEYEWALKHIALFTTGIHR